MPNSRPLKGNLNISAIQGRDEVRIALQDELSRVEFLEVSLTFEALARALAGQAAQPVVFELRPTLVGLRREFKREIVRVPGKSYHSDYPTHVEEALAPYEVDGWRGRRKDAANHHNFRGANPSGQPDYTDVEVGFERYVEAAGDAP